MHIKLMGRDIVISTRTAFAAPPPLTASPVYAAGVPLIQSQGLGLAHAHPPFLMGHDAFIKQGLIRRKRFHAEEAGVFRNQLSLEKAKNSLKKILES